MRFCATLTDTGRKINELEDLKDAFDKLVAPFNSTLRALEQEKSQNMSLSGMLTEARTSYETLRTEFYQIERNRRSSRLKAKDCAKISNLREKPGSAPLWKVRWRQPARTILACKAKSRLSIHTTAGSSARGIARYHRLKQPMMKRRSRARGAKLPNSRKLRPPAKLRLR